MRLAQKAEEELKRAALRWAAYSRDSVPEVVMMSARRELDDAAVGYHTAMNDLSNIGLITRAPKRLEELAALIRGHKFNFNDEDELQQGISMVVGGEWKREYRLDESNRIDFWHQMHRLGIEVKIDGSLSDLTRQVFGYTQNDLIQGVLVVTQLQRLSRLPDTMNGKPVRVAHLATSTF